MFEKKDITHVSVTTGTMVRGMLLLLVGFLIWFLRDLVLIVFTAIVIASFVDSAVPYFRKVGINRVVGVALLYIVSLITFAGLFYLFAPLLIVEVFNFSSFLATYLPGNTFLDYFQGEAFSGAKEAVAQLPPNLTLSGLLSVSKAFILNISGGFLQTLSVAFGSIFNVGAIILISFYLSIQEKGIENFLRVILPISHEDYVVDLWRRTSRKIALWVKGQMLLAVLITILTYLVLSLLGIKYALLLSIVSGITELVPYGILIALAPAVAFSYLSGGISTAFMVAGAYIIIHQFEIFLFSPLVINKVVGLSPIVIILSVLIGFELGGAWGLMLAIPAAVLLVEITNDLEKNKTFKRAKNEKE